MAINRGPYNALVDDDGSNLVGSVWNKAAIAGVLLDPIDAALVQSEGVWIDVPVNPAHFTASAGGTWAVVAGSTTTFAYRVSGKTMHLVLYTTGSTITGSPTSLQIALPGGYTGAGRAIGQPYNYYNGGVGTGWGLTGPGILLYKDILGTVWTAGTAHVTCALFVSLA